VSTAHLDNWWLIGVSACCCCCCCCCCWSLAIGYVGPRFEWVGEGGKGMRNVEGGPRTGRVGRTKLLRGKREGILDLHTFKWPELLNMLPLGIRLAADGRKERGRRASEREWAGEGWGLL
jgi:streptolysin S family bacteriocin protoxin